MFRNNRLSVKTKARQLHKPNIFRLRATENFQTRTEGKQKNCHRTHRKGWNEDDEKKEKNKDKEREKRKTSDTCVEKVIYTVACFTGFNHGD